MDILIQEFCCRDDIFILPKHYGTLDSELKLTEPLNVDLKQCRDWKDTQYLHFSHKGKPWTRSQAMNTKYYSKEFSEDVLVTIQEWFSAAHYFCPSLISPLEIKTKWNVLNLLLVFFYVFCFRRLLDRDLMNTSILQVILLNILRSIRLHFSHMQFLSMYVQIWSYLGFLEFFACFGSYKAFEISTIKMKRWKKIPVLCKVLKYKDSLI